MRSFGIIRGNATVRFMVEQSSRRRLGAGLTPGRGGPEDGRPDPLAVRWTRAFFDRLRDHVVPRMAVVDALEEGELRFFGGDALGIWALVSRGALVLAYEHGDSPQQIRDRARRWQACLRTRTAPGLASPHWGHPVYGARLEPGSGELDVVWAVPGDWLGFATSELPLPAQWRLPRHWSARETAGV